MRCRRCGHQNDPGANFCSSCGAALAGPDDETTLTLAALEDRQALEAEFGGLLEELAVGVGMVVVRRGPNQGSSFMLDRTVTTLGRHPDSDIFLDDVTVSRRHAEVRRVGNGFEVADAGSLNGTYVNQARVEHERLNNGDEVQVGKFKLVYVSLSGTQGSD
jgi:pSer/pThr/pTyr-binding forkhead associated (FHA) protein